MKSPLPSILFIMSMLIFSTSLLKSELIVSNDLTFFGTECYDEDITILRGATLTITGTLQMGSWHKINVRQGGHLVVDGGTITSKEIGLNKHWRGIYVEANPWALQTNTYYTGTVDVINGSLIENSRNGISTHVQGSGTNSGAIITCKDSYFRNNGRSIEFLSYTTGNGNLSVIDGCNFTIDKYFLTAGVKFIGHITSWRNENLAIEQSFFNIEASIAEDLLFNGTWGIYLLQTSGVVQGNVFTNHRKGLEVDQVDAPSEALSSIEVYGNFFQGNEEGAIISSNDAVVELNFFEVGFPSNTSIGLDIKNSTEYDCFSNEFYLYDGVTAKTNIGLRISNSGQDDNVVTQNKYQNLTIGVEALGENKDADFKGLMILCSELIDNETAILVKSKQSGTTQGIRKGQGIRRAAAGNTFINNKVDINNQTINQINYIYTGGAFPAPPCLNCLPQTIIGPVTAISTIAGSICTLEENKLGSGSKSAISDEMAESEVRLVSANPFTSELIFGVMASEPQTATLQLFSLTGQATAQQAVKLFAGENKVMLGDLSHLTPGVYGYRVVDASGRVVAGKVVKR